MPEMVACAAFGEVACADFVIITNTDSVGSTRLCAGTAKRHVASSPLQFYGLSQLRRSSSVRVQFKTEFLLGGGEFEFSSISSSIRYSTFARGGGKFEFSSRSSSVRVRVQFLFFLGGGGVRMSSSSVRVLLGYIMLI